jgi:hypothetical protein
VKRKKCLFETGCRRNVFMQEEKDFYRRGAEAQRNILFLIFKHISKEKQNQQTVFPHIKSLRNSILAPWDKFVHCVFASLRFI